MARLRHATLRNCGLSACGEHFEVDGEGILVPDPEPRVRAVLLRLAGYSLVAAPAPALPAEPEPAAVEKPEPAAKPKKRAARKPAAKKKTTKTTTRRKKTAEE